MNLPDPVAWMDSTGWPQHVSHIQSATERRLYGPLLPLFTEAQMREALASHEAVMRMALEALEYEAKKGNDDAYRSERDALRTALEEALGT